MNWFIIPSTNKAEKFWYIADHNGKGTTTPRRVCGGVSPSFNLGGPPAAPGGTAEGHEAERGSDRVRRRQRRGFSDCKIDPVGICRLTWRRSRL